MKNQDDFCAVNTLNYTIIPPLNQVPRLSAGPQRKKISFPAPPKMLSLPYICATMSPSASARRSPCNAPAGPLQTAWRPASGNRRPCEGKHPAGRWHCHACSGGHLGPRYRYLPAWGREEVLKDSALRGQQESSLPSRTTSKTRETFCKDWSSGRRAYPPIPKTPRSLSV